MIIKNIKRRLHTQSKGIDIQESDITYKLNI